MLFTSSIFSASLASLESHCILGTLGTQKKETEKFEIQVQTVGGKVMESGDAVDVKKETEKTRDSRDAGDAKKGDD